MKVVCDTNILIDFLNGINAAAEEFKLHKFKLISVITYIEVLVGAKNADEEQSIRAFLTRFEICGVTAEIADASIHLRKQHGMKVPDALIYATAQMQNALLLTRNTKDFRREWVDVRVPYQLNS